LLPITLYHFSPAIILQGAAKGIVTGSMIVVGLMFVSALFVGRLWCGWACPAGALQESGQLISAEPTPGAKFNWFKTSASGPRCDRWRHRTSAPTARPAPRIAQ
jgi:ferredoxin-type protein NapH